VAWWKADGNANDSVGGNNGIFPNGSAFAPGVVGQAFSFDGVSENVQVSDAPSLDPTNAMTLEGWFYVSAFPSLDIVSMATKESQSGTVEYQLTLQNAGGRFCFLPLIQVPAGYQYFSGATTVQTGTWYHVAMTYDGSSLKQYVNGNLDGSVSATGPIVTGNQPLYIGSQRDGWRFNGRVDELSLYNRALSQAELLAIYAAASGGKCVVSIAPSILAQPQNQTVSVGSDVLFSVQAAGTPPFKYQWKFNGSDISGATAASLSVTNVQFAQGGKYSVVVTNAAGAVQSSNALLKVVFPPATVQIGSITNTPSGGAVTVPITLLANGNENGLTFSLNFPPILSFAGAALGSNALGASLFINTSQIGSGWVGLAMAFPAGLTAQPGLQDIVDVTFTTGIITNTRTALISFGDTPLGRGLSDSAGTPLDANYVNGGLGIQAAGFEADVYPRPGGDESLTISDWVLVGRYAARLDYPTNGLEFQRADCAPRTTLGDGVISVTDWVQAGRYLAGLDPIAIAGGPTNEVTGPLVRPLGLRKSGGVARELVVTSAMSLSGQPCVAAVDLLAQGDENAVGFSVKFDPSLVRLATIAPAQDATGANLQINTNQASSGRIGLVLALPTGSTFATGTRHLANLTFTPIATNTINSPVGFGDAPVLRELSDVGATALVADYADGVLSLNPRPALSISQAGQAISLSWPAWATNYVLQSSDTAAVSGPWSNANVDATVKNGAVTTTVPASGQARYYRLFHQ
jgi:hypothetical protein